MSLRLNTTMDTTVQPRVATVASMCQLPPGTGAWRGCTRAEACAAAVALHWRGGGGSGTARRRQTAAGTRTPRPPRSTRASRHTGSRCCLHSSTGPPYTSSTRSSDSVPAQTISGTPLVRWWQTSLHQI